MISWNLRRLQSPQQLQQPEVMMDFLLLQYISLILRCFISPGASLDLPRLSVNIPSIHLKDIVFYFGGQNPIKDLEVWLSEVWKVIAISGDYRNYLWFLVKGFGAETLWWQCYRFYSWIIISKSLIVENNLKNLKKWFLYSWILR